MVAVVDETAATLEGVILHNILPRNNIMSYGWRGYSNLENLEGGIFMYMY